MSPTPTGPRFVARSPLAGLIASAVALAICGFLAAGAQAQTKAQAPLPRSAPTSLPWNAGDGFSFAKKEKKTRQSVSGIACAPNALQQTICLFAFDEGVEARFARLGNGTVQPVGQAVLLGRAGAELDAEGAATDGRFFYVSGSHAMKRESCAPNPASQHVLRLRRDPQSGMLAQPGERLDSGRLWSILSALPSLKPYTEAGHCLGTGGIDIEGLAVHRGRLFFGLRGPTEPGFAFIVSVDADAFFSGADAKAAVSRVRVGDGRGLRDMVAVEDGILLLAGPDDDKTNVNAGWTVSLWNDQTEGSAAAPPRPLAALDLGGVARRKCDKEIKPEAMAVLDETEHHYRLLILSDGLCDGGALAFKIAR